MYSVKEIEVLYHCDSSDKKASTMDEEVCRKAVWSVAFEGFEFGKNFRDFSCFEGSVDFVSDSCGDVSCFQVGVPGVESM